VPDPHPALPTDEPSWLRRLRWSLRGRLWILTWAVRWRITRLRGRSGEFAVPEDSDRSRAVSRRWEQHWGLVPPRLWPLHAAYPDRWVRFHSLPGSKRTADTSEELREVVRRHRAVVEELLDGSPLGSLVVIAVDHPARCLGTGWSKRLIPGAWPWRLLVEDDDHDEPVSYSYAWVTTGLSSAELDRLITEAADDRGNPLIAGSELDWFYRLYDGGADAFLPDQATRDALRARHADWLSAHPEGL
jgi:hypothetical protein